MKMTNKIYKAISFKTIFLSIVFFLFAVNTSFGAITFTYDESTNRVDLTGGTEGTPATFADFVTADRAGTMTLLDAGVIDATPDTFSLDAQPRPCEIRVLVLTISASVDRVGATMDIVGKDGDADAISELGIDISGAATTPVVTTLKFASVDASGITVTGMTNDDTITITQGQWGVIWDYGHGQYQIDADLNIGNGGNATYFTSTGEDIVFTDYSPVVAYLATLSIGVSSNTDYSGKGSTWTFVGDWTTRSFSNYGTILIYGSTIRINTGTGVWFYGTITIYDSIILAISGARALIAEFYDGTRSLRNVYFFNFNNVTFYGGTNILLEKIWLEETHAGFCGFGVPATITDAKLTNYTVSDYVSFGNAQLTIKNPQLSILAPSLYDAGWIKEIYTCDIHVTDKDGGAIANTATVACTRANVVTESAKFYKCTTAHTSGTFATDLAAGKWEEITDATILDAAPAWLTSTAYVSAEAEFSVNPTSGAIAEQTLTYKKWTGTSELETKYIHTFTISETGYKTLVMEDKEIDAPFDCSYELQSITMPPAPFFGDLAPDDYYFAEVVNE